MFNGSYGNPSTNIPTPVEEPSTSRSRRVGAMNDLSSSGLGFQYDFSQQGLQYQSFPQAPDVESIRVQNDFSHPIPLLPRNSRQGYQVDQSRRAGPINGASTSSSWEHGHHPLTNVQPTPVTPNINSGQNGDVGTSFIEHPPTVTPYPPITQTPQAPPEPYARPNAQGIPTPIWQLSQSWIDYEDGDDLRLIILFKKVRST